HTRFSRDWSSDVCSSDLGGFNQATILVDAPARFEVRGQPDYEPRNHDNTYDGPQTVRAHLNRSRNVPAVKTLEAATPEAVAEKADRKSVVQGKSVPRGRR